MGLHGLARRLGVAGADGLQDEPVVLDGVPLHLGEGGGRPPLGVEQLGELGQQDGHERIARGPEHHVVEGHVGAGDLVQVLRLVRALEVPDRGLHRGEVLRGDVHGGQLRGAGLHHAPHLQQPQRHLVGGRPPGGGLQDRLEAGPRVGGVDVGPEAAPHVDDVLRLERLEGLAHGEPADVGLPGDLRLGGQSLVRAHLALEDAFEQVLGDGLDQRLPSHRLAAAPRPSRGERCARRDRGSRRVPTSCQTSYV